MNKKKLFIIFIILVFMLSVQTASIAVIKGTVNTETVRVREEATTDSDIVKLVSIGDKITVTGESGNWYKVEVDGITGYIRKDLLDLDEEFLSSNGNDNEPVDNDNQNGDSNVDEGSTQNENTDTNNNQDNNENTSLENPNTIMGEDKTISTITPNQEELTVGAKKKLESEVKLKIIPLANSNNILTVAADTEVTIVEIMNSWCKIEAEENSGWIRIDQ